jgi:hypothetical protein
MEKFTLDEFKEYISKKREKKRDFVDFKNGKMTIHKENLNKYLEQYMCHDENDLHDTLYRSFGVWLNIID